MSKAELLEEIKTLVENKGYRAVFFNNEQTLYNNTVVTCITFTSDYYYGNATLYGYEDTVYRENSFSSLHARRLGKIKNDIENDLILGYTDLNGKSVFKNGLTFTDHIKQYVQTSDNKIHINTSDTYWKHCAKCGRIIFPEEEQLTCRNETVCKKCIPEVEIKECYICNEKYFSWRLRNIVLTDEMRNYFKTDSQRISICNDCYDDEFVDCSICGKRELKALGKECDCRDHRILYYSYKPRKAKLLSLNKTRKNTLFIGFENECECSGGDSRACDDCEYCRGDDECEDCEHYSDDDSKSVYPEILVDKLGHNVYCKEDGSLENGFEIVTEPMTYSYILANRKNFDDAFKEVTKNGAYSYSSETTGFHIHLSKDAFKNDEHLLNFASVIYADEKFSSAIAQRPGNSYCYYLSNNEMKRMKEVIKETIRGGDRYRAVNFSNSNTVEVRIYKGNLSFDSCLTYIQHAVSVFHYTALATKLNKEVSVIDYINYVNRRGNIYRELKQKIAKIIKGGKAKCA